GWGRGLRGWGRRPRARRSARAPPARCASCAAGSRRLGSVWRTSVLVALVACSRPPAPPPPAPAWSWVNPRPTGNGLVRVFADGARVWAVGAAGTILRSDDGGAAWTLVPSGTAADLTGVTGARGGVVGVGAGGPILAATDGATFAPQHSPTEEPLADVWANGHGRVFAVGAHGTILVSTNGGASWIVLPSGVRVNLRAVRGGKNDVSYAIGDGGTILRAEGDAATWHRRDRGTTDDLTAIPARKKGEALARRG